MHAVTLTSWLQVQWSVMTDVPGSVVSDDRRDMSPMRLAYTAGAILIKKPGYDCTRLHKRHDCYLELLFCINYY